jgi:N-carbamoylputrescine amidase
MKALMSQGTPRYGCTLTSGGYTGWPIGSAGNSDHEGIVYADVNLAEARRRRNWNEFNQVLRDRRTDLYDETLGAKITPAGIDRHRWPEANLS